MIIGIILLLVGLIYFLKNLGIIQISVAFTDILYPLLLIIAGLYLILGANRFRRFRKYKEKYFNKDGR